VKYVEERNTVMFPLRDQINDTLKMESEKLNITIQCFMYQVATGFTHVIGKHFHIMVLHRVILCGFKEGK